MRGVLIVSCLKFIGTVVQAIRWHFQRDSPKGIRKSSSRWGQDPN